MLKLPATTPHLVLNSARENTRGERPPRRFQVLDVDGSCTVVMCDRVVLFQGALLFADKDGDVTLACAAGHWASFQELSR